MIRDYKKMYYAVLLTFFMSMLIMFFETFLLSIAIINTNTVEGALEMLNMNGSWIIKVVRTIMQYAFNPVILVERLVSTVSFTTYVLIALWFVSFFKTRFWMKYTLIMLAAIIACAVILAGLAISLNTYSISQGFQIMHCIAWFDAVFSFILMCTCLVLPVLILGGYVEVL